MYRESKSSSEIYPSIHPSIYLSIYPSIYLSLYLFDIYIYIYVYMHTFIIVYIGMGQYMSIHIYIYIWAHRFMKADKHLQRPSPKTWCEPTGRKDSSLGRLGDAPPPLASLLQARRFFLTSCEPIGVVQSRHRQGMCCNSWQDVSTPEFPEM